MRQTCPSGLTIVRNDGSPGCAWFEDLPHPRCRSCRSSCVIRSGESGLAWVEPEANMLIAFNAAPGVVRDASDGYGSYAKALAEMIREGDLTPGNLFDRVRLRVHELTKGDQVPWDASGMEGAVRFFERGPGAPVRSDTPARTARMRMQPMRILGAHDAYMVALLRDTFRCLHRFPRRLLARPDDEANPCPSGGAARGYHLAAHLRGQRTRCLLVLS